MTNLTRKQEQHKYALDVICYCFPKGKIVNYGQMLEVGNFKGERGRALQISLWRHGLPGFEEKILDAGNWQLFNDVDNKKLKNLYGNFLKDIFSLWALKSGYSPISHGRQRAKDELFNYIAMRKTGVEPEPYLIKRVWEVFLRNAR